MAFNLFTIYVILRLILLNGSILGLIALLQNTNYYISAFSLGIVIVIQIISFLKFIDKGNQLYIRFLNSIRYDDYTQAYTSRGLGRSFEKLNNEFNNVLEKFKDIRAENEAQYTYLQTIVKQIAIGLIVINQDDTIELMNPAAKRLLRLNRAKKLEDFRENQSELVAAIQAAESEERKLVKVAQNGDSLVLAMRMNSITLRGKYYKIISLQDIRVELEDKEMEAWQKLIRVLTHEIINSVTPIASLAGTLNEDLTHHTQAIQDQQNPENREHLILSAKNFTESLEETHYAISTIQRRSEGLIKFVKDFRNLTRIPQPETEVLEVKDLLEAVLFLIKQDFKEDNIDFNLSVEPENLELLADGNLLEQVLINLVKNAGHALQAKSFIDSEKGKVQLRAYRGEWGNVILEVEDNGTGITEEALSKIFIPFFTTKKTGSGIGLSLSRQIMRLHGGHIYVESELGKGTVFKLRFP